MVSKKVVLFIVEGITDEISIGYIVTKLNTNDKIYFQVVNNDITANENSNSYNILNKIYEQVKRSKIEQHFKISDIIKVIHLVDTDGAFVSEDCIRYKDIDKVEYEINAINTRDIGLIKIRNLKKSTILNKLSNTRFINGIPYEIYFFSSNLEHVLHNIQNAKDSEKQELAEKFQDKFYKNPENFIDFINNNQFALKDEYTNTWKFIKKDNNSLKRYTNFNLFFDKNNYKK